jgi:hypothetical protein
MQESYLTSNTLYARFLLIAAIFLVCLLPFGAEISSGPTNHLSITPEKSANQGISDQSTIRAGENVGALQLGVAQSRALEIFVPKPYEDTWPVSHCSTEYNWIDSDNPKIGNVFIHFLNDSVFQIDSATTRFHTPEGITIYSSPSRVRRAYKGLRAYILSDVTNDAIGGRPMIYWIDYGRGIAFAFAYSRQSHTRYLYRIIVFKIRAEICTEEGTASFRGKRELTPYSLDVPSGSPFK